MVFILGRGTPRDNSCPNLKCAIQDCETPISDSISTVAKTKKKKEKKAQANKQTDNKDKIGFQTLFCI